MSADRDVIESELGAGDRAALERLGESAGADWWTLPGAQTLATFLAARCRAERLERVEGHSRFDAQEAAGVHVGRARSWLRTSLARLVG